MPTKSNTSYFKAIGQAVSTTLGGAKLTLTHLKDAIFQNRSPAHSADDPNYFEEQNKGIVTLRYPEEQLPVPMNGRYQLHNEIDDCIVCDKCAKICPVDCIDIEPIKSTEVIGHTSDGTAKRLYAAKFDIDMAKCCFCGLCTTVCPTECLTMTNEYDFSTFDVAEMNFEFAEMTEEEVAAKQKAYEEAQAAKKAATLAKEATSTESTGVPKAKPNFRPKAKPTTEEPAAEASEPANAVKKPVFRPKMKTPAPPAADQEDAATENKSKPKFRPKIKPKAAEEDTAIIANQEQPAEVPEEKPKPKFRPKMIAKKSTEEKEISSENITPKETNEGGIDYLRPTGEDDAPKPKFRPKMRPKINKKPPESEE